MSCRLRPDLTIARYTASESMLVPVRHNFWREKSAHEIYLRWKRSTGNPKGEAHRLLCEGLFER